GVARLPTARVERLGLEVAEHGMEGHPFPRTHDGAERHEVGDHLRRVEVVRVTETARQRVPLPLAPQRIPEVEDVVADETAIRLAVTDEHVERVRLPSVEVVYPRGDEPRTAKLPPVLVRDHVVRIIVSRP